MKLGNTVVSPTQNLQPLERLKHQPDPQPITVSFRSFGSCTQREMLEDHSENKAQIYQKSINNLPNKVLENCQRTARIIMLSQLQKQLGKEKKIKIQFAKILSEYVPRRDSDNLEGEYLNKKGYYESLNYSRVRIGQKQFIKNFLLNETFMKKFQKLFHQGLAQSSDKARKNQRSKISLGRRKMIITEMINQYKNKFYNHFANQLSRDMPAQISDPKIDCKQAKEAQVPATNYCLSSLNSLNSLFSYSHQEITSHYVLIPIMSVQFPSFFQNQWISAPQNLMIS